MRIYHACEGRIEIPSRGSPFGITRLAEGQVILSARAPMVYVDSNLNYLDANGDFLLSAYNICKQFDQHVMFQHFLGSYSKI